LKIINKLGILCLLGLLVFSTSGLQKANAQGGANISFQTFYDELAPYGQWVVNPEYGSVWIPAAEAGFQPYATNGHWLITEYGNTWVSDYVWGWAPFHYGRWFYDQYDGWCWIPGNEWGPAWVAWRSGADYYGWAPLGPGAQINVNINIPPVYWVFVPRVYITYTHIYRYCIPRPQVTHIYSNTVYIHNTYRYNNHVYVCGPNRYEIEKATHRSVPVYRMDHMDKPGRAVARNGSVSMYRPEVSSHSPRASQNSQVTERANTSNRRTPNTSVESNIQPDYRAHSNERNQVSGNEHNSSNRATTTRREANQVSHDRFSQNQTSSRENHSAPATQQPVNSNQSQRNQVVGQQRSQNQPSSSRRSSGQQNTSRTGNGRAVREQ
jgi:hypothetical protein